MNTHCRKRLFLKIIEPKIGIPIVVVLAAINATLVYRESHLNGLPDIGEPFDANRFGTVDISIEDNAFVDYNRASPTEHPMVSTRSSSWGGRLRLPRSASGSTTIR